MERTDKIANLCLNIKNKRNLDRIGRFESEICLFFKQKQTKIPEKHPITCLFCKLPL